MEAVRAVAAAKTAATEAGTMQNEGGGGGDGGERRAQAAIEKLNIRHAHAHGGKRAAVRETEDPDSGATSGSRQKTHARQPKPKKTAAGTRSRTDPLNRAAQQGMNGAGHQSKQPKDGDGAERRW